jgi:hypothetical protein
LKHFDEVNFTLRKTAGEVALAGSDGYVSAAMSSWLKAMIALEPANPLFECSHECAVVSEAEPLVTCLYSLAAPLLVFAWACLDAGWGTLEVMADDVSYRRRRRALSVVAPMAVLSAVKSLNCFAVTVRNCDC